MIDKGRGYIPLWRSILDWEWYSDINTCRLFIHLLIKANHEEKKWRGITILPGQFITSYENLSKETRLSYQSVRTSINKLKSTREVTCTGTSRYSLVELNNWKKFNSLTRQATDKQRASNVQLTTTKNVNNDNNVNKGTNTTADESANDVNKIFQVFYETINKRINFGNKTWRRHAEDLIKEFGVEEAVKLASVACSVQGKPYAPLITNPYQLKEKLASLQIFIYKSKQTPKGAIQSL